MLPCEMAGMSLYHPDATTTHVTVGPCPAHTFVFGTR